MNDFENFKLEIKPRIENLRDGLCQLENKQKLLNFVLTSDGAGGQKILKSFQSAWKVESGKSNNIGIISWW